MVLGTPLHRECIVCKLQQTPGWRVKVFKNIVEWPKRMDLWREWEGILHDWEDDERQAKALAFYLAHEMEMNE